MFSEEIRKVVDHVGDGIGGVVMGLDGIAIETYVRDDKNRSADSVNDLGMEFSFILGQVKKAASSLSIGGMSELALRADTTTVLIRMLNDEYFLAIVLGAGTNFGKARFLSRMAASSLRTQL